MELLHCAVLLAVLINAHVEVESRRFAHAEVAVNVGNARVEVREGEAAELSCTTESEIVFCTFVDPSGESLNMLPSLNYEDGRISFLGTDPKTQCGVKINNVQEKDNGEWMCTITATTSGGSAKKGTQTATVTVVKPPTSVRIDGEPSGSMELTLPTSNPKEIRCVAEGGRPAPKFSWMLGDKPYNGKVVDEEGAQVLTYIGKPEDNAKTLTCVVEHKGYKEESIANNENKASIALDIRFKPVANQKPEDFYGMQLGQSFDVLMKFKSHPEPTELRWKMHDGTVVAMGSENGRYKASLMQAETPHAGYFSAKLTITTVEEGDQESENSLFVVNELGETEYRFTLGLGEKPAAEANSGPVIIIVIVALLVVVVVVVAVVARAQGKLCFADPPKEDDKEKTVDKEEGSDTESVNAATGSKDDKDVEAAGTTADDEEPVINNNKKSVTARFSGFLSAMKKSVSKKEKYGETESEVKLQESIETKDGSEDSNEKKDDSIVYADLDKSAMSEGTRPSILIENERTEYAEISPQTRE